MFLSNLWNVIMGGCGFAIDLIGVEHAPSSIQPGRAEQMCLIATLVGHLAVRPIETSRARRPIDGF